MDSISGQVDVTDSGVGDACRLIIAVHRLDGGQVCDTYRRLLEDEAPGAPPMIAGLDVDLSHLIGDAVAAGIHLRVGLEDAPLNSHVGNVAQVEKAMAALGGHAANAAEIRATLNPRGETRDRPDKGPPPAPFGS